MMRPLLVFCLVLLLTPIPIHSAEYFVAANGDDSNPGTKDRPFRAIQKAADVMKAGDTCFIRAGRYHEEVIINNLKGTANKPITFTAYQGEEVTLDGTEPIKGNWKRYKGSIYQTKLNKDIWQLFVDGKMMVSARWPNATCQQNWDQDRYWGHGGSQDTDGIQYDEPHDGVSLAAENKSFTGAIAILNLGNWLTWARTINSHNAGSNNFTYDPVGGGYKTDSLKHHYFLECKLNLLDSEGEWFYDKSDKILYLWAPGGSNPSAKAIRGKTQSYAFGVSDSAYVVLSGLNFFATTFKFSSSTYITVKNCNFLYPSYSKRMLGNTGDPDITTVEQVSKSDLSECTVRNCIFEYTDGPGIYMTGRNNTIENCLFHDIDYSVVSFNGNGFTIHTIASPGITFRRNTIYTSGASEGYRGGDAEPGYINVVEYNHLYNCGLLQSDGGNFQIGANAGYEAIVRYNWTHDSAKFGIRFDGKWEKHRYSTNGHIHHNVCWDTTNLGFRIKGDEHETYNNTGFDSTYPDIVIRAIGGGMKHAITRNNAAEVICGAKGNPTVPIPGTHSNNWQGDIRTQLRDPDNLDFRPKAGSDLIDAGCVISGITHNFIGKAPDIGAYEYGDTNYWIPGYQTAKASTPIPPDNATGVKLDADLMWLGGYKADSHDVYFGTDYNSVVNATKQSSEYKGSRTTNIFDLGDLDADTTYYWRIDTLGAAGNVKIPGDVWSFETL